MRILGIDYGAVRVGLALSDDLGILAMPLETVEGPKVMNRICQIILDRKIEFVVIGMPRNMDGSYGPKAEEVRRFSDTLKKKLPVEIRLWDERLTTQSMERMLIEADVSRKKRKEVIDQLAAQQILQSYLDAQQELQNNDL